MNLWWGQTSIQSEELFTNIATGVDNHLHLWSSQKRVDMKNAILQNIKNIFVSKICLGVHNPCCIETKYESLLDGDVWGEGDNHYTTETGWWCYCNKNHKSFHICYQIPWHRTVSTPQSRDHHRKEYAIPGGSEIMEKVRKSAVLLSLKTSVSEGSTKNSGILLHWNYSIKKQGSVW